MHSTELTVLLLIIQLFMILSINTLICHFLKNGIIKSHYTPDSTSPEGAELHHVISNLDRHGR